MDAIRLNDLEEILRIWGVSHQSSTQSFVPRIAPMSDNRVFVHM